MDILGPAVESKGDYYKQQYSTNLQAIIGCNLIFRFLLWDGELPKHFSKFPSTGGQTAKAICVFKDITD